MSTPVEQIKERLGIVDVVGSYLRLERAGASLKAKCPFHNEKTASFFVSPGRNSFYCFGCNKGGDIFTFVQEFEGLDFMGALRVLASRAGVTLTNVDPKIRSEYARLYLCLEKAARFYEEALRNNEEARRYLLGRGLKEETIKDWRLGFAPNDWRKLLERLLDEGCTEAEMLKVGLVKQSAEDKNRRYDVFRGRIMFPIRDSAGRVVAFSGRILPVFDDGKGAKYINSPETVLFKKSYELYGFDKAKLAIRQKDAAILVEGQMDLLMAHQAGAPNTVAASGTALTREHLTRLKRLSENLLLSFDADSAGVAASERAIQLALSLGMNVKVIAMGAKDPAELILQDPREWERAVASAKHVVDFLLDGIMRSAKDGPGRLSQSETRTSTREQALAIEKKLLPLLRRLPSSVEQSHFLKTIAERSGLREEVLYDALKKIPVAGSGEEPPSENKIVAATHSSAVLRRLFGIYFLAEARNDEKLLQGMHGQLLGILGNELLETALRTHRELRDTLLLEAETLYGAGVPDAKEEQELIRLLGEDHAAKLLSGAMDKLAAAERAGRKKEAQELLQTCKELTQKLATLKAARFQP